MSEPRIYRASSLGYSLEQLVAPHLGYDAIPPPEWLMQRFQEGTDLEPQVLAELESLGWQLTVAQDEVNSEGDYQLEVMLEVIPGVATVRGHLDAKTATSVVEVKSMAEKSFKEASRLAWETPGLIQKYKWQLSAYMLATGLDGVLVVCSKGADGLKNLLYMYAYEPFYTIADIANKLQAAEDAINSGIIPEGCTDYPCPYFYLHAPIEAPEPAPADLDTLLDAWREANKRKKIYEAEEASLRDMIKEYVGEIAGKVRGSQGITVSTNWVAEKEVSYTKPGHWETRITTPREKKDAT